MTTNSPIRILIVDDHPIVRKGMIQLIDDDPSLIVICEADAGNVAIEQIKTEAIDVVVADFDMPGMNGLELTRELQKLTPPIPVVLLTMHDNEEIFNEALNSGVSAYLLKDEAIDSITAGIHAAAKGEAYVSPSLSKFVMKRANQSNAFRNENQGLQSITPTERKVLRRIAQNLSSHEIAADLGVSYRTITTHRNNISTKLDLSGKHPLLNFALANKSAIMELDE
ncbi:MAG: response regulator [Opitutaceae bacterium]